MAFISMVIASAILFVILTGLVMLLVGIILLIVWKVKAQGDKKVGIFHKILAVINLIGGVVFFVVPVLVFIASSVAAKINKERQIGKFDTQIHVSNIHNIGDVELDGINWVKADFLNTPPDESLTEYAVVIDDNRDYVIFYEVDNINGYDMYYIQNRSGIYVNEDEYEEIEDYYVNESNLEVTLRFYTDDRLNTYTLDDFDRDELMALSYDNLNGTLVTYSSSEIDCSFSVYGVSDDDLYSEHMYFDIVNDQLVLSLSSSGGSSSGTAVGDEDAAYLLDRISGYLPN